MTQEEFNEMLQAAIAQGLGGGTYSSVYSGEEIDVLLGMTSYAAGDQVLTDIMTGINDAEAAAEEASSAAEAASESSEKVKDEFESILELQPLTGWSDPSRYYYQLNGDSAVLARATAASGVADWQYLAVPCSPGDVFTVTGTGSSNPRAWGFTDKDPADATNVILDREAYGVSTVNKTVTAPEGAAYLIINRRTSLVTQDSYKGISPPGSERATYEVLKSNNSADLWTPSHVEETTRSGITYSVANGVVSLSGTASATFTLNMINTNGGTGSPAALPDWAAPGGTYYIDPRKTGDDDAIIRVIVYDDGGTGTTIYGSYRPGFFTIPSTGVHHMIVRVYIPNGSTVSCTMKLAIMSAPTNLDLYDYAARPMKIRIMQNNLGHFRWGFSTASPDANGMSEAKYQEVLANYKRLYGDYQPDILCVQEYVQYMDKALTHDAATVLYDPLYPISSAVTESPKIFAAADVSNFLWMSFAATDTDQSTYTTRPVRGELASGARRIAVLTGALNPLGSWVVRESQLTQILEYLESYDCAIMAFDLNPQAAASGETRPAAVGDTASSELQHLLGIAAGYGFTPANGGYWGTQCTYVKHKNSSTPGEHYDPTGDYPLDNILVKGDVKIRGFKVLSDWYEDLASDHVPVIADLYIY